MDAETCMDVSITLWKHETFPRMLRGFNWNFEGQNSFVKNHTNKTSLQSLKMRKMFSSTAIYNQKEIFYHK